MDAVLFYFYLMRNAFSRIHPHVSSLLISGPYVLGGFHVITKKGRGDAIAGISNDNKA